MCAFTMGETTRELHIRRMKAELADIADDLEALSVTASDEQRQELKKREGELSAELLTLQVQLKGKSVELRLTAENIRNIFSSPTKSP